ncbi:uncharacterized protein LTR77_010315 [Saxophila tyrrhenica]|uniref:ASST-domain-containing protein n=1 Tax=Saxophila tyrrhenica TaxID=1690608 RepID=A0AAV9NW14_9PEZI|nr:hypothetical protein LTR77_010315 [Saxophila tyrrhenica]
MFQQRSSLLTTLFLSLWATLRICRADRPPYLHDDQYNEGERGRFVQQKYRTSDLEPPMFNMMTPFSGCDDGSYFFMSPRGNMPDATFYIMDHDGAMVWGPDHHYGEVYNFQVQKYKGEQVLVFWAGDDSIGGHGEGQYYMLNKHYEEIKIITGGNDIRADLHAFTITEDNHAIFTGYKVVQHDLTEVGRPADSYIWESLFQEIDIETGDVVFEWRASEHFPFLDSYVNPNKATRNDPWDFFHINMVEKDADGNYLVSTRYGRCVIYISGETKEILWTLGGKRNSFKDLSDGEATLFLGQHDAHWYKGHEYITMFDNRGDWFHKIEDHSKGHMIKVDLGKMTAELVASYVHPDNILSTSQGSMQVLPNEQILIGYGFNGAFTQFTWEGEMVCDAYFEPRKRMGSGDVQSYRDLKSNWTGIPLTTPAIAYEDETLYMSWLGTTKTRKWLIQDSDAADGLFETVQETPKKGFETEFDVPGGKRMRQYVRVIAVDEGGTQLSISPPVDLQDTSAIWKGEAPPPEQHHDDTSPSDSDSTEDHHHSSSSSEEEMSGHEHSSSEGHAHSHLRADLNDHTLLLALLFLAACFAAFLAAMVFGCRCLGFRRLRSEKDVLPMPTLRDDGPVRRFVEGVLAWVPGRKRSWREGYAGVPTTNGSGRGRGESLVGVGAEMEGR